MAEILLGHDPRKDPAVSLYFSVFLLPEVLDSFHILLLQLFLSTVHILNLLVLIPLIQSQFLLSIVHNPQFLLLKNFHSAHFQSSPAKDVQQWLRLVIKIKKLVIPNLSLYVTPYFVIHTVP